MSIDLSGLSPSAERDRRERLGVTSNDLAARAGISPQELETYEQAKSEADADPVTALKVADALDELERESENGNEDPEAHPS